MQLSALGRKKIGIKSLNNGNYLRKIVLYLNSKGM
jgi:hypothetical protein